MMLDHIKETACPECGCNSILSMGKMNRHTNGQWNERLKFECGMSLHYSPNFQRVQVEGDCPKSAAYLAWKERRSVIAAAMVEAARVVTGVSGSADLIALERSLRSDLDLYRDVLDAPAK